MNNLIQKAKRTSRKEESSSEEMKRIAFVQFKALAKKNLRLPIEAFQL